MLLAAPIVIMPLACAEIGPLALPPTATAPGLLASALTLAGVQTVVVNAFNQYVGYISMMAAAFLILLVLPRGISDYLERRKLRAVRAARPTTHA